MPQSADSLTTQAIVLRKTPYSDTSLIIACISPIYGQIHFIAKGALKSTKSKFPEIDLFRLLDIQFTEGKNSTLCTLQSCEAVDVFDRISQFPKQYMLGQWIAQFMLKNIKDHHECPMAFQALLTCLKRLSSSRLDEILTQVIALLFVYLSEEGLLTHGHDITDKGKAQKLDDMIRYALDVDVEKPVHDAAALNRLRDWLQDFIRKHHLVLPDGFDRF